MKKKLAQMHSEKKQKLFVFTPPIFFLIFFLLIPILNIFIFSFWSLDPQTGMMKADFNFNNYATFFSHFMYFQSFIRTIEITFKVTLITLILAYPTAYYIAFYVNPKIQSFLIFLIILPSWSSLLIRTFSWMSVLRADGFLDTIFKSIHLISEPLNILYTEKAVVLGLVHIYLPFMILPIFSNLKNFDISLLNAARVLGATSLRAFLRITLPISLPGIVTGVFLVGLPSFGAFIIPKLLGGTSDIMIGNVIEMQFKDVFNWPFGAAVAGIMTLILVISMYLFNRFIGLELISGAAKKR
jgi:spermidine/putrescine transport system permease protein